MSADRRGRRSAGRTQEVTMRWIHAALAVTLVATVAGGCGGGKGDKTTGAAPAAKTVTIGHGQELPPAVTAAIETKGDAWDLIAVSDEVWVGVDAPADALQRIDTKTGKVTASVERGQAAAFDGLNLWVARPHSVVRVDPESGEIIGELAVEEPGSIAAGEGAVWTYDGSKLIRIDPETEKIAASISVPMCEGARGIAA